MGGPVRAVVMWLGEDDDDGGEWCGVTPPQGQLDIGTKFTCLTIKYSGFRY